MGLEERVNRRIGKLPPKEKESYQENPNYATKEDIEDLHRVIASSLGSSDAITREQLKILKKQQRKERVDGMIRVFRKTTETLASKPISHKRNNELFFGTRQLREMTRRRND